MGYLAGRVLTRSLVAVAPTVELWRPAGLTGQPASRPAGEVSPELAGEPCARLTYGIGRTDRRAVRQVLLTQMS